MNKFINRQTCVRTAAARIFASLCFAFAALTMLAPAPAQAQALLARTWVSGLGNDADPCSRTQPCLTFAGAIDKTAAGGEISVLDPGGFGAVSITKSISIVNDTSGEAGILANGTNGVAVLAPSDAIVILRGLTIDGGGATSQSGINFIAGAALHVEKCLIKNFTNTSASNGYGILFTPGSAAELYISHTTLINNGAAAGSHGGAIFVAPSNATATGTVKVNLNDVQIENNRTGLGLNTTSGGAIVASVNNTTSVGNTGNGLTALTAGGPAATMIVKNSVIAHNATGLVANGSTAAIRIGDSTITGNTNAINAVNGGSVTSYKTNQIDGNTNNNTPITQQQLN